MPALSTTITLHVEEQLLAKFRVVCEHDGITPTGALAKYIQEYVGLFEEYWGPIELGAAT